MADKIYTLHLCLNTPEKEFTEKLTHIIEEHICDSDFDVNLFSNMMSMSRTQLHRKLKKSTGLSTTAFIRKQRIQLAQLILTSTSLPISQICILVGFNDPSYFTQCFKNITGILPSKYNKNR